MIPIRSATCSGRASWNGTSRRRSTVAPTIVIRRCRVAAAAAAACVSALVFSSIVPSDRRTSCPGRPRGARATPGTGAPSILVDGGGHQNPRSGCRHSGGHAARSARSRPLV
ncbi:hypothetical protein NS184_04655 [Curtobacterium luteum]|uniref:Uncharacterized protein n=1 Tax=Curtobacterium luteum TaxID=33881 RepID=A0A175RYJ0_9MICO|nr:hypothetical protein NS184_04655 [Curtobacterium luteum]